MTSWLMVPSVLARVLAIIAPIAQRIEQQSSKLWVEGSSPSWGTIRTSLIIDFFTIIACESSNSFYGSIV